MNKRNFITGGNRSEVRRDRIEKFATYARYEVPEYWIVDPIESCITVLSLEGAAYALVGKFGLGEQAASKLLDGFTVDVAATFKAAEGAH